MKIKEHIQQIKTLVDAQAEDEGLWFKAENISEAYLQQALRKLHEVIENKTSQERVQEILEEVKND